MKAKIIIRKERPTAAGLCPLALKADLLNGEKVVIGVRISVRPEHFADGLLKRSAPNYKDNNIILQQILAKANEIIVRARLAGRPLTAEDFKAEWQTVGASQDFLWWFETELDRQRQVGVICLATWKGYRSTLKKLKRFSQGALPIHKVTHQFLEEFDSWHGKALARKRRTVDGGRTARIKALKGIRKFLRAAIRSGLFSGVNPFGEFKMPKPRNSLTYLTKGELQRIWALYQEGQWREELRPFLFSCLTGLRFGDAAELDEGHIVNGRIQKDMQKGSERTPRRIDIPLTAQALQIIRDGGMPLVRQTDQHINRTLKDVAVAAAINKRLTYHVSRHTFATLFLEAGGSVEVLQQLMGHGSLAVTMVYVHVAGERRVDQMKLMEGLL